MDVAPFKKLLLDTCGFCFENEREETLVSGLRRRISSTKTENPGVYLEVLSRDPQEMRRLVELLTVNETYFLREPDYLRLVIGRIIPEILRERPSRTVKLLSAGCSTGEEVYSLAILLRESLGGDWERTCQVAGVDIDGNVLAAARRGEYGKGSFRGMDPALVERYFEPYCEGGWRLTGGLREAVRFEAVNLCADEYPPMMHNQDFIFYRNVSIYFPPRVQRDVFRRLAGCLNDGGYLLVGAAETLHHDIGILTLLERDSLFVYRKIPDAQPKDRRHMLRLPRPQDPLHASPSAKGGGHPPRTARASNPLATILRGREVQDRNPKVKARHMPPDAHRLFEEALCLARGNKANESMAILDRILELDGTFIKAHTLKGSILMNAHRSREARAECQHALALNPFCLDAKVMLGMAAFQEDDGEQARKYFREAIYLSPICWLAHFHLAEIMYSLGERKRARGAYETSMKILEGCGVEEHARQVFPLVFNAAQFLAVCRHKLDILQHAG